MKFNTGKTDVMFKQYYLQISRVQDFTASAPELFGTSAIFLIIELLVLFLAGKVVDVG